jgi:maltooligosyltrehalose trehalohydrolase
MMQANPRESSFGAVLLAPNLTRFRIWAPQAATVALEIEGARPVTMSSIGGGWHQTEHACGAGTKYRYRVSPDLTVPDPASRLQAHDVHDCSIVVDPNSYRWKLPDWRGRPWHEAVIYELHVGAFGGFAGVTKWLHYLAELGVTAVELMPVADFPGPRNWGYDGVLPYAPDAAYGSPDDLKRLIDTAHGLGLMVLLDVVYNHFGPDGNYLGAYAADFYRHDRTTPWGDAIDFRRPEVRRFFIENALYWLTDYRFDGLRFDAVHAIGDSDFLLEMAGEIRASLNAARHIHLILENENNDAELLRRGPGLPGFDAQWADDAHHCIHVMLTGETEAYYEDFAAAPAALLARCLAEGFAYQGEASVHNDNLPRGTPSAHLPPTAFVICLQNHDQIGNRAYGERLSRLADPDGLRAATVLLLLTPQIPLLFMGQEWATATPFLYFTSHEGDLADAVRNGRRREFARFAAFSDPSLRESIPDPNDLRTFGASIPDTVESADPRAASWLDLHRRLLAIRAADIIPRMQGARAIEATALGEQAVRARWRMGDGSELTIAVNFGAHPIACPPPEGRCLFAVEPRRVTGVLPGQSAEVTLQVSSDAR